MKRTLGMMTALCLAIGLCVPSARADEMDDLLKLVPGDFAVTIVVPNLEAMGEKAGAFAKSVDPASEFSVKESLENLGPMASHIDFTKPMVMAQEAGAGGGGNPMVTWVYVDGAAEKLKGMDGAAENAGIWTVPGAMAGPMFARIEGKYVVVASSPELLPKTPESATSMAPSIKAHKAHLKADSALVHINFAPLRPLVQAQLMQVKQMAPMLGMMMAGDPTNPMAGMAEVAGPAATTLIGLIEEFVNQTESLDISIGVSESAIDAALFAKFSDGGIQSFLSQSKAPADQPLSTPGLENFTFAWGARFNGVDSPMATFGQMFLDAVKNAPPMPAPGGQQGGEATGGGKDKIVAALGAMVEAAKKSNGTDSTTAVIGGKQAGVSTFVGGDAKELVALQAKSIESGSNLMGGASYEKKGESKRGGADVVEFARMPSDDPMAAMMPERFAVGMLGGNAATVQGDEAFVESVFAKKGLAPTRSSARAKAVVDKIGKGANGILLLDLAGVVQMVSAMFGTPGAAEVPPGPPVGAAMNLTNNPARIDIHIPAKAISRVMQMQGGDAPM